MTTIEQTYFSARTASAVTRASSPCPRRSTAFTLVELMISIALALVLMLGVNQIFTYTTKAVGAGEAINSTIRLNRAFGTSISNDMANIVPNGPNPTDAGCLIIGSRSAYGYRNPADLASQGTTSPNAPTGLGLPNTAYIDINGDGKFGDANVPGEVVWPCTYNFRNHRLDCLSFFARDTFHRQTGNPGTFVANQASNEAWIWYGHLWLPTNDPTNQNTLYPPTSGTPALSTSYPLAGTLGTNPNNYFATQLVLGRVTTVLTEQSLTATPSQPANTILDTSGTQQWFIDRASGTSPTTDDLTPLYYGSQLNTKGAATTSTDPGTNAAYFYNSRVDLASTTISNYRQKLTNYIAAYPYNSGNANTYWWTFLSDGSLSRFQCNPFVGKPMQSLDMAHAAPYLVPGCSQFIVEYAGDFLTQDNDPTHTSRVATGATPGHAQYGDVTGPGSDGQIDFFVDSNNVKQISWYGMPRSTSGKTTVCAANGDVVPLRDRFQLMWNNTASFTGPYNNLPMSNAAYTNAAANGYPTFEKIGPQYQVKDYTGNSGSGMTLTEAQNGYTVAFGPNDPKPKLIRITMTLEDPTGRLPDGQTYQYVFQIP